MKYFSLLLLGLICCATTTVMAQKYSFTGYGLYYSDALNGNKTAYGEIYDRSEYTCANLKFPKNTLLKVTRLDNSKSVTVRVNDKGPFHDPAPDGTEYIIDLSMAAANAIDLNVVGKAMVKIEQVGYSTSNPVRQSSNGNGGGLTSYDNMFTSRGGDSSGSSNPLPSFSGDHNIIRTISPNVGGYGIQIGSYMTRKNAERQVVSLQKIGVDYLYLLASTNSNGNLTYKLIICKFDTKEQAEEYMALVKDNYMLSGFVKRI